MTPAPRPYRDGRLYVCSEMCETCVFHPGNRMDLNRGRLREVVRGNLDNGSALTCHRTIYEDPEGKHAICRGFFDRFKTTSEALALAVHMGIVEYIAPLPKQRDSER